MQTITIAEYSHNIDFQAYVNDLSYVCWGETVLIITLDKVKKLITKKGN